LKEWQSLRLTHETVGEYFNGNPLNVGGLLGAASRGLTDIDLDCRHAVVLAPHFLPPTPCLFEDNFEEGWVRRARSAADG
jgi:hypothetical protein